MNYDSYELEVLVHINVDQTGEVGNADSNKKGVCRCVEGYETCIIDSFLDESAKEIWRKLKRSWARNQLKSGEQKRQKRQKYDYLRESGSCKGIKGEGGKNCWIKVEKRKPKVKVMGIEVGFTKENIENNLIEMNGDIFALKEQYEIVYNFLSIRNNGFKMGLDLEVYILVM